MFTHTPLIVIGTLALAVLLVSAVYGIRLASLAIASRRWLGTPAHVSSVSVAHRRVDDRTLGGERIVREVPMSVNVEYAYTRDGRHQGHALTLADLVMTGLGVDRRDITELQSFGSQISVWVDPAKPARAVVFRRVPATAITALVLVFAAAAVAVLVSGEELISSYGSLFGVGAVGVAGAAILHLIARGIMRVVRHRS